MKATTYGAIGLACAFLIVACVALEKQIGRVTSPDLATLTIDTGCAGGTEFLTAAIEGINPVLAQVVLSGVKTACALRADRTPIASATYDDPLDAFCTQTSALGDDDAVPEVQFIFNQRRLVICGERG